MNVATDPRVTTAARPRKGVRHAVVLTAVALAALVSGPASAQVTGYMENYDAGDISRWEVDADAQRTFQLSAENQALRINYTRTASSWEWDNFHWTPPAIVNVSGNPLITIRVKSTINTELAVKPVYDNDSSHWLTYDLRGDSLWRVISLSIPGAGNRNITRMYLYLDGGTTTPRTGVVYFDEMRLGDSAYVVADLLPLQRAVAAAQRLVDSTEEGTQEGQFPPGSKSAVEAAISHAQGVLTSGTNDQQLIDQETWDLYDACVTYERNVTAVPVPLVDPLATRKTRYLYLNLTVLAPNSLLFGMHDATGYGVGWSGDDDRSDVKDVCGDYPAVYSEDMNGVDMGGNVEGTFYRLSSAFDRGGVITMCWHQYDPDGRGFYAADVNNERIVSTILPGGSRHQDYRAKLHRVAAFLKSLRGASGESIPVIFRPYHEHTGNWFWWGPDWATTGEYNALWQFTSHYLHDSLNVHNLLWAISPTMDAAGTGNQYFTIYPGDAYVDVFGADNYFSSSVTQQEIQTFSDRMTTMVNHAQGRTKLAAMTEVGQEAIPMSTWFTQAVLSPIKDDSVNTNIVYAAVWRNASTTHHFAPYPGHSSVPDFLVFYNDPYTLFESDLPLMYVLPQPDLEPPVIVSDHDSVHVSPTVDVAITVETNERAYMRYGPSDAAFADLPYAFTGGEGGMVHTVTIASAQGESGTLYVRARDLFGNAMAQSTVIRYEVDTLEMPVYWTDLLYPVGDWPSGAAPIGTDAAAVTHPQPVRTVYFRTPFTLTSLPTAMAVFVKSYGGFAASVNGHEVGRVNFNTTGRLEYDTDPTATGGVNKQFLFDSLALRALRIGENVVTVEVHAAPTGSVPSFDAYVMDQTMTRVVPFGATWSYFDRGYRPTDKTLREVLNAVSDEAGVPAAMALSANYPNPFNPATTVGYALSRGTLVTLEVYDMLGRRVAVLVDEYRPAGTYTARFDAGRLASGTYILRMRADGFQAARKMLLLR